MPTGPTQPWRVDSQSSQRQSNGLWRPVLVLEPVTDHALSNPDKEAVTNSMSAKGGTEAA
jgi:hypothetical protein